MSSTDVNYDTIWREWLFDLFFAPHPHSIPIERLRGYDALHMDEFRDALVRLRLRGWINVDFFDGVTLSLSGAIRIAATALHMPTLTNRVAVNSLVDKVLGDGATLAVAEAIGRIEATDSGRLSLDYAADTSAHVGGQEDASIQARIDAEVERRLARERLAHLCRPFSTNNPISVAIRESIDRSTYGARS